MTDEHSARASLVAQFVSYNNRIQSGFKALEGLELSYTQWRVLEIVQVQQICTQTVIAQGLKTTHANVSQVLTRLQNMGYIERQKQGVRRLISLTDRATQVLSEHRDQYEQLVLELLGVLSPQEQQIMSMWMARLSADDATM